MASKVLVPPAPFAKLPVKKSHPEQSGTGFVIGTDAVARVAHLEHSVRFLQEQHRLMLSGLHAEIEALRERNRDLQFQLIFNKENSSKNNSPASEETAESNEEADLKREVARLEREAAAARGEARAAEARALQLQRLVDAQTEKLRELELRTSVCGEQRDDGEDETRGELRARLAEAERLVRRLRGDAERQRRELQCMKNSLHASLRASGLDYGYQNTYHFPPLHAAPEYWREPLREEFSVRGTGAGRRPLTLPELAAQQLPRATVYANPHARPRGNGHEHKNKKHQPAGDAASAKSPEESAENRLKVPTDIARSNRATVNSKPMYQELKVVITKILPHSMVSKVSGEPSRARPRRHHPRRPAPDHT